MPTFDFECAKCKHTFEGTIDFGERTFPPCPECGSKKTEKKLSAPIVVVFKGNGFYKTDSAKKPKESIESPPAESSDQKPDKEPKKKQKEKSE